VVSRAGDVPLTGRNFADCEVVFKRLPEGDEGATRRGAAQRSLLRPRSQRNCGGGRRRDASRAPSAHGPWLAAN